jgi:glycosyltransferase involved in cell wall biosynthesis
MKSRNALFIQVTEPGAYPPLMNAAYLLSEAGWAPTFLSAPINGSDICLPPIPNMRVTSLPRRPNYIVNKSTYASYCIEAFKVARALKPDIVYCSDPIGALPGLIAARTSGARLFYHEHDSPNTHSDLNPLIGFSRKLASRLAEVVVFPNHERGTWACKEMGLAPSKLEVVWNVPRRAEVVDFAQPKDDKHLWLYFHGSIAPDRLPETIFLAAAQLSGVRVRVVGYEVASGKGYMKQLQAKYGKIDEGGIIDWMGPQNRSDIMRLSATSHVGLSLMPDVSTNINLRHLATASNKAFDYMAAGLPLIVSDLPEWRAMFVEPGHGIAADPRNIDSLVGSFKFLQNNKVYIETTGRLNRQKILDHWNYEQEFAALLQRLECNSILSLPAVGN